MKPAARLAAAAAGSPGVSPSIAPRPSLARLPLAFEPNVGQAAADVRYVSRSAGMRLEMTDGGVQLIGAGKRALGLRLVGASAATVEADEALPGRAHYYTSTDPADWRIDVPMYRRVVYRGVYPSIDLVFHGDAGQLEFDFVVQPGGNPGAIRLELTGADAVALDGRDVVLRAGGDTVRLHEPVVYQHAAAGRASVAGRFRLDGRRLAFDVGDYDRTRPLVIDPVVTYATYFGGPASDSGKSIGVDSAGNMYVSLGDSGGNRLIKLSADGRTLLYTVNLGDATPSRLVTDPAGNVYLQASCPYPRSGFTFACPILNSLTTGHAQAQGDSAAYVMKFAPGGTLLFSTSMGGFGSALPGGIALDAAGNIYATAWNVYGGFPLTGPVFSRPGGEGGFHTVVEAISADLSRFLYVVEFQTGNSFFAPRGLAVDGAGAVYLTGMIQNSLFPTTPGAFQPADLGFGGGVVAKIAPGGGSLAYSTYFGSNVSGANNINPTGIAVDAEGNAYIAGWVGNEPGLPTANAIQPSRGGGFFDVFVARLNPAGSGLVFSTYLGGSGNDGDNGMVLIALDSSANVYVAGSTSSSDFPRRNELNFNDGSGGNFVTELTTDGQAFVYSTFFANTSTSIAGMTVTATGTVFLTGWTTSLNTVNPYQATYAGLADAFIAKLEPSEPRVFITSPAAGATVSGTVWSDVWVDNYVGTSNTFTLSAGGTVLATGTGTNHVTLPWDSRSVADGSITLTATVLDAGGHVGTGTRNFLVRNGITPTLAAAFTSPAEGATVSGIVSIGMSETGASGTPITFTLTVDGTQVFTASGTATTASFNWNTAGVSAGAHTLGLTVRDGAGRVATATRGVTVAGATGSLGVFITSPAAGSTVSGTVWSDVWVQGAAAGARTFTLSIGGVQLVTVSDSGNHVTLPWDSTRVANGTQTLVATVRDATGNSGTGSRSLNVQNAGGGGTPTLAASFTAPAAGATVSGSVSVGMSATGASGTPIVFTLTVDGTQVFTTSGAATSASFGWNTTSVGDGAHTLGLTVSDGAGRIATVTRSVSVQNTTPPPPPPGSISVFITEPRGGATVSGTVWFTVWIQNAATGMKTYTLTEGGRTLATVNTESTGPVSVPWATTSSDNGPRAPAIGVRDSAGATGSATLNVTVAN